MFSAVFVSVVGEMNDSISAQMFRVSWAELSVFVGMQERGDTQANSGSL
jgi:hypothetical protein